MTLKEARLVGASRYFTGVPCPQGHISERYTCNFKCYDCARNERRAALLKNPSKNVAHVARWRQNNPEKYAAQNKRAYINGGKEHIKRWMKDHPEEVKCRLRNYRAKKRAAIGRHSSFDVDELFLKQDGICFCGFDLRKGYHVDHKTPLSRGGSNWPDNLQLLCASCNTSKGAKTDKEWRM